VNNLYVNPTKVGNGQALALSLSSVLNMPTEILESLFIVKKRRHLEILRKMNILSRDIVKKRIDTEKAAFATISSK
jgi:hypothetical protein